MKTLAAKGSIDWSETPIHEYRDLWAIDDRIPQLAWLWQLNRGVFKSPGSKWESLDHLDRARPTRTRSATWTTSRSWPTRSRPLTAAVGPRRGSLAAVSEDHGRPRSPTTDPGPPWFPARRARGGRRGSIDRDRASAGSPCWACSRSSTAERPHRRCSSRRSSSRSRSSRRSATSRSERGGAGQRDRASVFLIVFLVLVLIIALSIPAIVSGVRPLFDNAPELGRAVGRWLRPLGIDRLSRSTARPRSSRSTLEDNLVDERRGRRAARHGHHPRGASSDGPRSALFTFYMVAEGPKLRRADLRAAPPERQKHVLFVWDTAIDADRRLLLLAAVARGDQRHGPVDRALALRRPVRGAARDLRAASCRRSSRSSGPTSGGGSRCWSRSSRSTAAGIAVPRLHRHLPADRELLPQPPHHGEDDVAAPGGRLRGGADRRRPRRPAVRLPRAARGRRDPVDGEGCGAAATTSSRPT